MSSCWRYGGEAGQVVAVGQHGQRLGAEEVVVPDAEQAEEHRQVLLERRGAEVLVDGVEAVEHLAEAVGPDGDHQRQADGRVVASSGRRPSPRSRTCWRCRCRTPRTSLGVGGHRHEVLGHRRRRRRGRRAAHSRAEWALVIVSRVVKVFERDDEQRLGRVEVAGGLVEVGAVDVGDEPHRERRGRRRAAAPRRPCAGPRSEPPMPMLTTLRIALAGVARPTRPSAPGRRSRPCGRAPRAPRGPRRRRRPRSTRVARRPQRDVQHGAVLGDVDLLAGEHGVAQLGDPGACGPGRTAARASRR